MTNILEQIRKGMAVSAPGGDDIGTVEFVHFTDVDPASPGPEAASVGPVVQEHRDSVVEAVIDVFRTDEVPDEMRDRLMGRGFIRVDVDGLFASDRYIVPDQIASVTGDRVMLKVSKKELMKK